MVTAAQTTLSAAAIATCNTIASTSSITQIASANATTAMQSAPISFLNAALGATYPSVVGNMPPVTAALKTSEIQDITAAAPAQRKAADATVQTNAGPVSIQTPSAPVVIVKQPQPVIPYSGQTSYKGFKEYFARLALCNGWTTKVEKAQNLLVAMEGAAAEAVRKLMLTQDSDCDAIWDALARRFGHMDEPERAMRLFDVAKQAEHESLALFEQNLRTLYRKAWPGSDMKSKDADSVLQRRFLGGILDAGLQQYLRLHARTDDFSTTVTKARQYVEAQNLAKITMKPAIRIASSAELEPRVEVGLEGTRRTDQFHPLRVTLLQQVNPPIGESNFVMTHPGVMITEPLTSNIHAKGVITAIGLRETRSW